MKQMFQEHLRDMIRSEVEQTANKVIRAWRGSQMIKKWTRKGVLLANLYLEPGEIDKLKP